MKIRTIFESDVWKMMEDSLETVTRRYQELCGHEKKIEHELDAILDNNHGFQASVKKLYKDMPNKTILDEDAARLPSIINFAATLAFDVSSKVKRLDLAKTRVTQCIERIDDLLDLKGCTDGIETALTNEEYEQAAAHINRFLDMDESVLKRFAVKEFSGQDSNTRRKSEVLTVSSMDEAFSKLHKAEAKLREIVIKRFDEAVNENDVASVERFFKIFPLLKLHDEGLKKFSEYLCTKINVSLNKNIPSEKPQSILDQLTHLYEMVAKIIDIHQPLVETYYGHGKLIYVIGTLQKVCDEKTKRILNEFKTKRDLTNKYNSITRVLKMNSLNTSKKYDPRELDSLLTEITLVNSRNEAYLRFIYNRAKNDIDIAFRSSEADENEERNKKLDQIDNLIRKCELQLMIQEINGTYVLLEEYFLKESAIKAIQIDDIDPPNSLTSSMLDDVFFIVKKCIRRALSSGSIDVLCAVVNHSVSVLETSFCDALNERLRNGYPSTATISGAAVALDLTQAYSVLQTGRYLQSSSDIEKTKVFFLTALNNLDTACDYIKKVRESILTQVNKNLNITVTQHKEKPEILESCMTEFSSLKVKFQSLLTGGLRQVCSSVFKPRIKTWIDSFAGVSHIISEDEIQSFEGTEGMRPFTQSFIVSIDNLLKSFKETLTTNNFDILISLFSDELNQRLENVVMKCSYNKLGGFQFDRELRGIMNYLSSSTVWSIRDKFTRLKFIGVILSSESVNEVIEYLGPNTSDAENLEPWKLISNKSSLNDVKHIMKLRVDFDSEDIFKVKF